MMVQRSLHSIVNYLDDSLSLAKQKLNVNKVSWLLLDCFIQILSIWVFVEIGELRLSSQELRVLT